MRRRLRIEKPESIIQCGAVEIPPGSPMRPPCHIAVGRCDEQGRQIGVAQKVLVGFANLEAVDKSIPFVAAVAPAIASGSGEPGAPEQIGHIRMDPVLTAAVFALWPAATWYGVPDAQVAAAVVSGRVVALVAGLSLGGREAAPPRSPVGAPS